MTDLFSMKGHVALVTGASRGLGFAMAEAMAEAGATVVLNGRDPKTLAEAAARLAKKGLKAEWAAFDVADHAAGTKALADTAKKHGRLDCLIANAGITHRKPLLEFETDAFRHVVEVDLTACFVLAREAARIMIPQGRGRIIFTGSIMGVAVGRPTVHAYAASKAGLMGLTRSLAAELGRKNVTVNTICPGFFLTELNKPLMENPEFDRMVKTRTAMGRWAEPPELGGAAVFLASRAGSYVNGHMLFVDGGLVGTL